VLSLRVTRAVRDVRPAACVCVVAASLSPVPLEQSFIGVSESNPMKRIQVMNQLAFDTAIAAVRKGKQVRL
jgi:hypothetical protein